MDVAVDCIRAPYDGAEPSIPQQVVIDTLPWTAFDRIGGYVRVRIQEIDMAASFYIVEGKFFTREQLI